MKIRFLVKYTDNKNHNHLTFLRTLKEFYLICKNYPYAEIIKVF